MLLLYFRCYYFVWTESFYIEFIFIVSVIMWYKLLFSSSFMCVSPASNYNNKLWNYGIDYSANSWRYNLYEYYVVNSFALLCKTNWNLHFLNPHPHFSCKTDSKIIFFTNLFNSANPSNYFFSYLIVLLWCNRCEEIFKFAVLIVGINFP